MIDLLRVHEVWTLGTYIKTQQPLFVSPVLGAREQKKSGFQGLTGQAVPANSRVRRLLS